jgi:hypothetical protein
MPVWEYQILTMSTTSSNTYETVDKMDAMGKKGWELVAAVPIAVASLRPDGIVASPTNHVLFCFKRQLA